MKTATKEIPVQSSDGKMQIGTLSCGETVLVLKEDKSGIYIAYIIGRVAPEHMAYMVDEGVWETKVSARDKLMAFVEAQVGCLNVLGAQGQRMTPGLIKRLEHITKKDYERAMAHYKRHCEKGQTLVAYDCSGLIVAYLKSVGLINCDLTADELYCNVCEQIEKNGLHGGDLVFSKSATQNRMVHVGVYMGDGTVVHAKGRDDGVVRESIIKAGWNRFGRLKYFEPDLTLTYRRELKVKIRPCMSGDDVIAVQRALNAAGFSPGKVNGSYGPKTSSAVKRYQEANGLAVDGIVDYKTWAKLIG